MIAKYILIPFGLFLLFNISLSAQQGVVKGVVKHDDQALEYASVGIPKLGLGTLTDSLGHFELKNIPAGTYDLQVTKVVFRRHN